MKSAGMRPKRDSGWIWTRTGAFWAAATDAPRTPETNARRFRVNAPDIAAMIDDLHLRRTSGSGYSDNWYGSYLASFVGSCVDSGGGMPSRESACQRGSYGRFGHFRSVARRI